MISSGLPSLQELSRLIHQKRMSPLEAVEGCLSRIGQRENSVSAWACVERDEARRQARRLTEELTTKGPRGPLHGIPFGVKDIFDTADMPTCWGSALYSGRAPDCDAELVARFKRAGAIVLGKTHTTAFAYFDAAPTRNPHNLEHTPGGSSSGSAAAVADGMAPFALGSQTLGSVLRPASFCGVVGLKPTFGCLPVEGMLSFAPTLDHAGSFTRTVEEMALLWVPTQTPETARAEEELALQKLPPVKKLTVVPWPPNGGLEAEMEPAFASCCARLAAAGFAIERIALPGSFAALPDATLTVTKYEGARFHRRRYEEHGERIGAKLAALVEEGLKMSEPQYKRALANIRQAREEFALLAAHHPVWLTPAAPGPAPKGLEFTGDPRCNLPFTALGVPALSLPFGRSSTGLPLGLQAASAWNREDLLLATALVCEKALSE